DLSGLEQESVDVLLCLPLLSANGGNLENGQDSARPRRWQSERVPCSSESVRQNEYASAA
ncbi:hypothetical protein C3O73_10245, partial [Cronobacter sakazakii]